MPATPLFRRNTNARDAVDKLNWLTRTRSFCTRVCVLLTIAAPVSIARPTPAHVMKVPLTPHRASPNRVYPPGTPGLHGLTSVITFVVVVSGLYFAREVLIPITLAVLLSFLLAPLVGLLRRLHFGQLPSIFVAVLLAVVTLLAVSTLIGAQIAQLAG